MPISCNWLSNDNALQMGKLLPKVTLLYANNANLPFLTFKTNNTNE